MEKRGAQEARIAKRATTSLRRLYKNPFQALAEITAVNMMREVGRGVMPDPPDSRYVKMRSGPMRGRWVKIHETSNLWKEGVFKFVVSSNISAIAYNPRIQMMQIEFRGGSVYTYKNVTCQMWFRFNKAMSKGKWFWRNIRPFIEKYPYKRVRFNRKEILKLPKSLKKLGYKT